MALLCAGILALSPAGGHLAYASETQGAQETSAAPETEVTELEEDEEDPAAGAGTSAETGDTSTTAAPEDSGSDQEEPQDQEDPQDPEDEAEVSEGAAASPQTDDSASDENEVETDENEESENDGTHKDPLGSLLPLEEKQAALILSDFSLTDLKNIEVSYIVDHLQDPEGNYYDFSDSDQFVWSFYKDEFGERIYDEYHVVSRNDTVDMSVFDDNTGGYKMELIVGDGTQLGNNVRYIVNVYLINSLIELNTIELYTQDAQGNRVEVNKERAKCTLTGTEFYVPGHRSGTEYYLGITSQMNNHPSINVVVYTKEEYQKRLENGWQSATPITDIILNPKMWMKDQGYRTTLDVDEQKTFVMVLEDPTTHSVYLVREHTIAVKGSSIHVDSSIWTREDGNLIKASEIKKDPQDWSYYNIYDSSDDETIETHELGMLDGTENNTEFYIVLTAHHDGYGDDAANHISYCFEGSYNSYADAKKKGAKDQKSKLFANPEDSAFSGYKVSRANLFAYKLFTVFFDDGAICKIRIGVFRDVDHLSESEWQDYYSQPVVGERDPWFRVTGVKKGDRELDAYVVENGKSKTLDTYYGMGYQTLFVNEYLSDADLKALKPVFWVADNAKIRIRTNANQGAEEISGVTAHDFTSPNEYYALFEGRQKNYIVEVVPKKHGPKLYVFGADGTEYERNREIFLDDYYQYRHDILIANVGDQKLQGLSVRLENASHVKIDDYWTVGGEGNNTLEPFTGTGKTEQYGELQNLAKVRVEADGSGEIKGDLVISANGQESVVIHLSGSSIQPVIRTSELTYAVKYVPYSYIISTSNMNEKVDVTYDLWGKLPDGMKFDSKTGELYGVPKETGTYPITVTANFSEQSFAPSTQNLQLEVKDNEDEIVFNATDEGYEIIPEENGMIGYIGEQVSDYSFELDLENAEETFITNGDISEFERLWINGVELKAGTDYVAEPGSTISHLFLDIIRKKPVLKEGRNTISVEYNISRSNSSAGSSGSYTSSSSSGGSSGGGRVYDSWSSNGGGGGGSTVRRAAQNFWIGVNPSTGPTVNKYFKISKTSANLHKGKTLTLKISRNYTTKIAWASTNPKVARVNGYGKVTAVGKGNCTIVAKSDDGKTQKCKIHVMIPVKTIKLNKTSMKLGAGKYETLKLTVTPSNVDKRDFTWTSSNPKIATVNSSGRVKGISKGTCTIMVKTPNGKKRTCRVTIYNIIPVKSVKLNAASKTLNKWATYTLKATISPSNASNKTLKWYSSNTKVAKVNSAGKVTAVGPGKARIRAKSNNGKIGSCLVTVKLVPVSGVRLKLDRLFLKKDYKTKLSAVILPSYASDKSVTWSSSDESIVTVVNGEVTGIEEGTAVITVTSSNGKKATCDVSVVSPDTEIPEILILNKMLEIETGKTGTIEASIVAAEGADKTILWESTRPDVASVKDGVVTAKKAGYTTIIARTLFNKVATCSVRVKPPTVDVTKITLDKSSVILNPDYNDTKTAALTVKFTPANATDTSVTWKSANESIAVVKGGIVSARKAGTTKITATTANGKTAVCQVTVETGPKRIRTKQDLISVSRDLGADYILTCDIDLAGSNWTPIGLGTEGFHGTFDGNGHSITNMEVSGGDECGLFASCRGTIQNLIVHGRIEANASVTVSCVGGICGILDGGTIQNCRSYVVVWCGNANNGNAGLMCGGIAGRVLNSTISGCISYGLVFAQVRSTTGLIINAGGIAGYVTDNSTIEVCGNAGNVVGVAEPYNSGQTVRVDCGGIAGEAASNTQIRECGSTGRIGAFCEDDKPVAANSLLAAGGIAGVQEDAEISGCRSESPTETNGPNTLQYRFTASQVAVKAVSSIDLSVTSKTLHVGDSFTLSTTFHPSDAYADGAIMESLDTGVATVNNGVVKAVGVGETRIFVYSRFYSWAAAMCDLTVLPDDPNEIYHIGITGPEEGKVGVSQQVRLETTTKPESASGQNFTWSTSDSTIATVDQNGLVTTKKTGDVTITARASNGVKGETTLHVLPAFVELTGNNEYTVTRGEKIQIPLRLHIDGSISPGGNKYKLGTNYYLSDENSGRIFVKYLAFFNIDGEQLFEQWYGDKASISSYTVNGNIVDAVLEIDTAKMEKMSGAVLLVDLYPSGTTSSDDAYNRVSVTFTIE